MLGLFDSIEFHLFYLAYLCIISFILVNFWLFQTRMNKIMKFKLIFTLMLIIALVILILDSIPYLYTNFYTIPIENIILSNIHLLLLGLSFIFYELLSFEQIKEI